MKLIYLISLLFSFQLLSAQNISGTWYGKITQQPGAYRQTYDLELTLNQKRKGLSGESYATITDSLYIKIGFTGSIGDQEILLKENINEVRQEILPPGWHLCIKNLHLQLRKIGDTEYLEGTWDGKGRDQKDCIPGKVFLARSREDLGKYVAANEDLASGDSIFHAVKDTAALPPVSINFSSSFLNTEPRKVTEIEVNHTDIKLQLSDYMKVDNDTVSVYLNRSIIANKVWISKKPAVINFRLDNRIDLHELLLFAENLGQVPPNTSELLVIDGDKTHRVLIESDKQKSATVYLRYKP